VTRYPDGGSRAEMLEPSAFNCLESYTRRTQKSGPYEIGISVDAGAPGGTNVADLERGHRNPSRTQVKLANALGRSTWRVYSANHDGGPDRDLTADRTASTRSEIPRPAPC
jgi:hypothetical protein